METWHTHYHEERSHWCCPRSDKTVQLWVLWFLRLIFAATWNLSGATLVYVSVNWWNQYVVVDIIWHYMITRILMNYRVRKSIVDEVLICTLAYVKGLCCAKRAVIQKTTLCIEFCTNIIQRKFPHLGPPSATLHKSLPFEYFKQRDMICN